MAVRIACDSSADLGKEFYEKHNIPVIPYTVILGEESFQDGINITVPEMYDYVTKTKQLPKTSAINEFTFQEFFESIKNPDGVVYFNLSSQISCTYANAERASKNFEKLHVVDTLSLSTGVGMLVRYAVALSENGASFEEIVEKVEEKKKHIQASFIIDRLDFLHKGGRCSTLQLLGANLLKLHPSIILKDGKMLVNKKYKGKLADIVKKYMDDTLMEYHNPDKSFCFITCTELTDQAIIDNAVSHAKSLGFKEVYLTYASATISCHCGRNTIGILYFNDGE